MTDEAILTDPSMSPVSQRCPMRDYFTEKLALRGRAAENMYFAEIDRELSRKLRAKQATSTETADPCAQAEAKAAGVSARQEG